MSRSVDLGPVTAYAIAVKHGYTGTEEEWIAYVQSNGDLIKNVRNRVSVLEHVMASPLTFKGAVAAQADLPTEGMQNGDMYYSAAEMRRYAWSDQDQEWVALPVDESEYADLLEAIDNKADGIAADLYRINADTDISGEDIKLGWLVRATDGACVDQGDAKFLSLNSYIPVSGKTVITVDSGYTMRVAHYRRRSISSFTEMLANWDKKAECENGFIRLTIKKEAETDLTEDDVEAIHIQVPKTGKMWADPEAELINAADPRQLWRTISGTGDVVESGMYATSRLIPIGEDDAYRFRASMHTSNNAAEIGRTYVVSASFYDRDGTFISTLVLWSGSLYYEDSDAQTISVDTLVPLDPGARFVRLKWVRNYTDSVSFTGPSAFDSITSARTDTLENQVDELARAPREALHNSTSRIAELVSVARTYRAFSQVTDEHGNYYLQYGSGGVLDVASEAEVKGLDCSGFVGLVLRGVPVGMTPYVRREGGDADYIPPAPEDDIREEDLPDSSATGRLVGRNPVYAWSKDLYMWKEKVTYRSRAPYRVRAAAQIAHWFYDRGREIPLDSRLMDAEPGDVIFFSRMYADGNWQHPDRFRHVTHTGIIVAKADNPLFDRTKEFDATDIATFPYIHTYMHCTKTLPCIRENSLESVVVGTQTAIQDGTIPENGVQVLTMICRPDLGDDVAAGAGTPTAARFGTPGQMIVDSGYLYVGTANPDYDDTDVTSNPVVWKRIPLQGM